VILVRTIKRPISPVLCCFDTQSADLRRKVAIFAVRTPVLGLDYMPFAQSVERWQQ
jgi:hypothetical protein